MGSDFVVLQGPEPAHAGMLADYMRHNIGQLLKPRQGKPLQEPSQPTLQTQVSGDDQVKASFSLPAAVSLLLCFVLSNLGELNPALPCIHCRANLVTLNLPYIGIHCRADH